MCSKVVPTCSNEGGNTITPSSPKPKINPAVRWSFTLNNYTDDEFSSICSIVESKCRFAIIGKEVSSTNTPHLQGYIEFHKKSRPLSVFRNKRIHFEKSKGDKFSNIEYCSKEDKKPYRFPAEYKVPITQDDFYNWENFVYDILSKQPNDRDILWLWEEDGCAGKTTFAKWLFQNLDNVVVLSGKASDMKNGIIQYETANGVLPKIVIINIPRASSKFVSYTGLEEIKDMFFFSGKYEGGMVCGPNPHLLCFANEPPEYSSMSEDRWKVYNIKDFS